jgi:HPt (histidine-containing phosphotransfer) domain-containing protein
MRELHAIAGEAGLLGIAPVMQLARQAEDRAKRLRDDATQPNADALAAALRELRSALDLVGASSRPPGGEP